MSKSKYSEPDNKWDTALTCKEGKLYFSSYILTHHSTIVQEYISKLKSSPPYEIKLTGVSYTALLEILPRIDPFEKEEPITDVELVLAAAGPLNIKQLIDECRAIVIKDVKPEYLSLVEKYYPDTKDEFLVQLIVKNKDANIAQEVFHGIFPKVSNQKFLPILREYYSRGFTFPQSMHQIILDRISEVPGRSIEVIDIIKETEIRTEIKRSIAILFRLIVDDPACRKYCTKDKFPGPPENEITTKKRKIFHDTMTKA